MSHLEDVSIYLLTHLFINHNTYHQDSSSFTSSCRELKLLLLHRDIITILWNHYFYSKTHQNSKFNSNCFHYQNPYVIRSKLIKYHQVPIITKARVYINSSVQFEFIEKLKFIHVFWSLHVCSSMVIEVTHKLFYLSINWMF